MRGLEGSGRDDGECLVRSHWRKVYLPVLQDVQVCTGSMHFSSDILTPCEDYHLI